MFYAVGVRRVTLRRIEKWRTPRRVTFCTHLCRVRHPCFWGEPPLVFFHRDRQLRNLARDWKGRSCNCTNTALWSVCIAIYTFAVNAAVNICFCSRLLTSYLCSHNTCFVLTIVQFGRRTRFRTTAMLIVYVILPAFSPSPPHH
jgi:hypothetical protein